MISPLIFLLFFGTIEFGRALMVIHTLEEAVRTGCRMAIIEGTTETEVQDTIQTMLNANGITTYTLTTNPTPLSSSCQWDPVTVTVTVSYDNVSWLPALMYLSGQNFTASCTLPQEGDPCNAAPPAP